MIQQTSQSETRTIKKTPVFDANRKAFYSKRYRVIANQGSTRSSKTYSICQLLIVIAHSMNTHISICSPSMPHLKLGAMKDFFDILKDWGLYDEAQHNMTDNVYTVLKTQTRIEFFGADEPKRLHGPGRKILYINEANLIPYASYSQLAIRTTDQIFIDFNPADEFSWVYTVADAPGNKLIISTYRNNRANLSQGQIDEIESYKDADENFWNVYGLGKRGTSSETIYTHYKICNELPLRGQLFMGQDFGYNVPSALLLIEEWEGRLYWDEWLYKTKLTTADIIEEYKQLDVSRTIPIYADSAEPKTIEEICRAGYNMSAADKDVTEGIRKVKSMPLFITQRSVNTLKEIKSYKYQKRKSDGLVLDDPIKINDHAMDAGRYGTFTHLATDRYTWGALD